MAELGRLPRWLVLRALYGAVLALASYGQLYIAYKDFEPATRGMDFFHYRRMYEHPLDFTVTQAPFVYRQVSAVLTYFVYKSGAFFDTPIAFQTGIETQRLLFAALVVNYTSLLLAALVTTAFVDRLTDRDVPGFALLSGFLCLLSFHAPIDVLTGLTDGVAWLLIALLFYLYLIENRWLLAILLAVAVLQRETIFIIFGSIALYRLFVDPQSRGYNWFVLLAAAAGATAYLVMRKFLFPAPGHPIQLNFAAWPASFLSYRWSGDIWREGVFAQNVVFICLGTAAALKLWGRKLSPWLPVAGVAFLALWLVGMAAAIGNSVGRITAELTPLFAALSAVQLAEIEEAISNRPPRS
ncbi:MAG: hypothetical protein WAV02_20830 [Stellaceae bacterium]